MDSLVVGDDDCNISDIISTLNSSPVIAQLENKLPIIALELGRSSAERQQISTSLLLGLITASEALADTLKKWRDDSGPTKATLAKLLDVLNRQGLRDFASLLERRFKNIDHTDNCITGNQRPTRKNSDIPDSDIKKQKCHIINNLSKLIDSLKWTPMLVAKMQAGGILNSEQVSILAFTSNTEERAWIMFGYIHGRLNSTQPTVYRRVITIFDDESQTCVTSLLKQILL